MIVCTMMLHLDLYDVHSLKGRRSILNSLKEKLKTLNVSILDISGEYPKEASLAIAFLSADAVLAAQSRHKIESIVESKFPQYPCETDYEEI